MPKVIVPYANGMEEMEATIVVDVLRRAGIEVSTAGLEPGPVEAARKTKHIPDTTLDEALREDWDMIVLPGGTEGAIRLGDDSRIIRLLQEMRTTPGKWLAAICAAPALVLERNQILRSGELFTGFPGTSDSPEFTERRIQQTGNVITSMGPGSAFEFALYLVETLIGQEKRNEVESKLCLPAIPVIG